MPDYSKGKIYKIWSPSCEGVYIGGTCVSLKARMRGHRYSATHEHYKCRSKDLLLSGDAVIELIEDYPCADIKELSAREGYYQRITENCVNRKIEGRTKKEYEKTDKMKEYRHKWYEENKERLKVLALANREKMYEKRKVKVRCECGTIVSKGNLTRHKKAKGCAGSWSALT